MAITSQVRQPLGFGEAVIADWQAAGLIKTSVLKPAFTTIESGLVVRRMGELGIGDIYTLSSLPAKVLGVPTPAIP